jgi:hypothetical protein
MNGVLQSNTPSMLDGDLMSMQLGYWNLKKLISVKFQKLQIKFMEIIYNSLLMILNLLMMILKVQLLVINHSNSKDKNMIK